MNKKLSSRVMSMCLALALVLCVTIPVEKVEAASEGDKKYAYQVYTLAQINELCNTFESLSGKVESGNGIAKLLASIAKASVAGSLYTATAGMIKYDLTREYNFYKNIRDEMIRRGAKKVKIRYTSEYSVYKYYWEKFYSWKVIDKKAVLYK